MTSLVLFSINVSHVAAFYEALLEAQSLLEPSGCIRVVNGRDELLVHTVPAKIAKTVTVEVPPVPRDISAIKPIFEVGALAAALDRVRSHGGVVTKQHFVLDGLRCHDVLDPDGNVIQLRSHLE